MAKLRAQVARTRAALLRALARLVPAAAALEAARRRALEILIEVPLRRTQVCSQTLRLAPESALHGLMAATDHRLRYHDWNQSSDAGIIKTS